MKMPVSPVIYTIIGTDLIQCVLVALNKFLEFEELGHLINLGMNLIKTVLRIHI